MATKTAKTTEVTKTVPFSNVIAKIAQASGSNADSTGKRVRAHLRRDWERYAKDWPGLAKAKANRDGNRYPDMPRDFAEKFIAARVNAMSRPKVTADTK